MYEALEKEIDVKSGLNTKKFLIRERSPSVGDKIARRKTLLSYEAIGKSYFLVKNNLASIPPRKPSLVPSDSSRRCSAIRYLQLQL